MAPLPVKNGHFGVDCGMRIHAIPCLEDNYAYLVVCDETRQCAIVDPGEAEPVVSAARALGLSPREVWCTHHHPDHVGGNEEVALALGVKDIVAHASDKGRIPGQTKALEANDEFSLGALKVRALHVPGHTLGAIAYVVTDGVETAVFTGDTMFIAGCGRLFEGTAAQMHASLARLAALDPSARVYCGHEYTLSNLRFAKHLEPSNVAVDCALVRARALRDEGEPTVPSTIGDELEASPFLRPGSAELRATLGIAKDADDVTAFAAIREAKNGFR
jgi:hydroxyacylglutathione hydrolase